MERCIGEKFKYNDNVNLIAVEQDESKIDICGNCVFNRNTCYKDYDIVGDCSSLTRIDGKNVIFLETGDIDFDDSYKYSVFEDFFSFIKCEHGYNLMKN